MTKRKIMVTIATIYANGPPHLGHVVEQVQADIWARFQRLRGHDCIYITGSDAHGTPIMLSAEKLGVSPEELIKNVGELQRADFRDFLISVDNFYTSHSPENKILVDSIYQKISAHQDIKTKTIEQAFDAEKKMFLPDRYVKGTCPRCGALDQYGDNCEVCSATYAPTELIDAVSVISGTKPMIKESLHYFFQLNHYTDMLKAWTQKGTLQTEVANKLQEWLQTGLEPWDISRDAPYFGFKIPGTEDKYFYVWLDAPIGYMASLTNFCSTHPNFNFDEYWNKNSTAEIYHFIGKDIINFHCLFWPAMLESAGFRTPTAVYVHGFLTVDGQKMSKSRGTFIKARTYLENLSPEYLRYYFAAKLSPRIDDIDLNFDDFTQRVNADLVGKIVNIASRCSGFIHQHASGVLAAEIKNISLFTKLADASEAIAACYENREFNQAVRKIMELADLVNQYIDEKKPWALAKIAGNEQEIQQICSLGINCFRQLTIYLKPILPLMAEKVEKFLNISPLVWDDLNKPLLNHSINLFTPLMQRIDKNQIAALKEAVIQDKDLMNVSPHAGS